MMISLTAACAAWVLSGCFGGADSSTRTVVPQSPTPIAATTPTFKATTRTPRSTPSVIRVSPSPSITTEASVHAVPRETKPTSKAAPPPPPREEAAPAPQREAAAPAPAPVCITRIAKPREMLERRLCTEEILGIEANLIEMVMESPVSGVRRSTTSRC